MASVTIYDGEVDRKDPADVRVYTFDWDTENLATSVEIVSQVTTVASIQPSGDTALTVTTTGTGLGIQTGNRTVKCKLSGGTLGALYRVTNTITTNETPAQIKERSFYVRIEDR